MVKAMVGRQPVFDRDFQVQAYELLFRAADGEATGDGAAMTAQVVAEALGGIGIEHITGSLPGWVNAGRRMLTDPDAPLAMLPAERMGIEVLEHVPPDPEVLAAVRDLKGRGFTILLDDVTEPEDAFPFLPHLDIVKIDIQTVGDLAAAVRALRPHPVRLLAEKVETYEDFERARALNFDYYQGAFFCRPDIVEGRAVPASKLAVLRAMQQVLAAEAIEDLHEVIRQDVGLSFRLLRYINSAAFGLRRGIESVEQAMSLLGLVNLRRWLSLLALSELGGDKPAELLRVALFRGRFMESVAEALGERDTADDFLVGLFSVLDALLDLPMDQALADLPLDDALRGALLGESGAMREKLALALAAERGEWQAARAFSERHRAVTIPEIGRLNIEAMQWADAQVSAMEANA
ncbi:MAG: HDOD domain-containing protein [Mariprofundaceae bacterium]